MSYKFLLKYSEYYSPSFFENKDATIIFCNGRKCLINCEIRSECNKQFVFRPTITEGEMHTFKQNYPERCI